MPAYTVDLCRMDESAVTAKRAEVNNSSSSSSSSPSSMEPKDSISTEESLPHAETCDVIVLPFKKPAVISETLSAQRECSNCQTTVTTTWRRNEHGKYICNACGLFYRLHKRHRPPEMRKLNISRRRRQHCATDESCHDVFHASSLTRRQSVGRDAMFYHNNRRIAERIRRAMPPQPLHDSNEFLMSYSEPVTRSSTPHQWTEHHITRSSTPHQWTEHHTTRSQSPVSWTQSISGSSLHGSHRGIDALTPLHIMASAAAAASTSLHQCSSTMPIQNAGYHLCLPSLPFPTFHANGNGIARQCHPGKLTQASLRVPCRPTPIDVRKRLPGMDTLAMIAMAADLVSPIAEHRERLLAASLTTSPTTPNNASTSGDSDSSSPSMSSSSPILTTDSLKLRADAMPATISPTAAS